MAIPWIGYTPIEMSADCYDLLIKDQVRNIRLRDFDAVISATTPIVASTHHSNEIKGVAHYLLAEMLFRRGYSDDVGEIVEHAEQSRRMLPDNIELLIAAHYVQAEALIDRDMKVEAADSLRQGVVLGRPVRHISLRWALCARTLAWLTADAQEELALLDEIIASKTKWTEMIADAYAMKSALLNRQLDPPDEKGAAITAEILARPELYSIHREEKLTRALKNYLLYDYEGAVEEFTEVIESILIHYIGADDLYLVRAYQGRGDSYFALELNDKAEQNWKAAETTADRLRSEITRQLGKDHYSGKKKWWVGGPKKSG